MLRLKTHFNTAPADYEAARSGHLERRRAACVRTMLAERANDTRRVMEIGTGTGRLMAALADEFPQMTFQGLDIEPGMIAYAQQRYQRPNAHYSVGDITTHPVDLTVQFIYSIDVIHHIHEPLDCFASIRRHLETGGTWLAIEPNMYHPYIYFHQERMRRAGFDEDHFRPYLHEPLFKQAGFAIASRHYAFFFPGWLQQVAPLWQRLEQRIEGYRFSGGSVIYCLQAQ